MYSVPCMYHSKWVLVRSGGTGRWWWFFGRRICERAAERTGSEVPNRYHWIVSREVLEQHMLPNHEFFCVCAYVHLRVHMRPISQIVFFGAVLLLLPEERFCDLCGLCAFQCLIRSLALTVLMLRCRLPYVRGCCKSRATSCQICSMQFPM